MEKEMTGFSRKEVLIVEVVKMPKDFQDLFYQREDRQHDYQRYYSEFQPYNGKDYSHTFTQENLVQYWKDQTKNNKYEGSLEDFIRDYNLEMDVWFINCGYDFTGVKEIILDY